MIGTNFDTGLTSAAEVFVDRRNGALEGHRQLFVPQREPRLVLVDAASSRMRLYRHGRLQAQFTVGLGPGPAAARLPGSQSRLRGMYFVVERDERRLAINYPNRYDALRARRSGLLSHCDEADVRGAWQARRPTPGDTPLGGGVAITAGLDASGRHATSPPGRILMRDRDLVHVLRQIPARAMVVIF